MPVQEYNREDTEMVKEGWHLDKKVPLTIIIAIATQTVVLFMWGARLDQRVTQIEGITASHTVIIENMRASQSDTKATLARMDERLAATSDNVRDIKAKFDILDGMEFKPARRTRR